MNERYRYHPATGSFAVETEGEITRWDKFAAHRSRTLGHMGHSRAGRKGSRHEVAVPPRRQPRGRMVRHIGECTTTGGPVVPRA
ncbi:hypothetical protein GCM10023080_004900 [Streptomyces pseudoechinosporeus]